MDEDLVFYYKYSNSFEENPSEEHRDNENCKKKTLPPDHPLLAQFQKNLKEQLQSQIDKVLAELNELNIAIRKNSSEKDDLGVNVYEAQQLVSQQQDEIHQIEKEIEKIQTEKEELDNELKNIKEVYKQKKTEFTESKNKDNELQNEIESMNFLMLKMKEWEQDLQSEMAVNKRIAEKSKKDKQMLSEEKRQLDFIIFKLMAENEKLEKSLEQIDMQIVAKEKEREELAELIATSYADQEELEVDVKRLCHSWNCVVVAIKHKDNIYFTTKTQLENERENLRQLIIEINAEKKICNELMTKNEQLTMIKDRVSEEKTMLTTKLSIEQDLLALLQNKLENNQVLLVQNSQDLEQLTAENKLLKNELNNVRREIERQIANKVEVEEKICNLLQEQISCDKVAKYMDKTIREKRELNRTMEINLVSLENQNSEFQVNIEKQKAANDDLQRYLDELIKEQRHRESELSSMNHSLSQNNFKITNMYRNIDKMTKRLEEAIEKAGGMEISPEEVRIKEMEKLIAEGEEKNKNMQKFWLRQQSFVIELSEKKAKQMSEISLIRKQVLILEQKNLKLEDEYEDLKAQDKLMLREIKNLQTKLVRVYDQLVKEKDSKTKLDALNNISQLQFSNDLKEIELECLQLESENQDLQKEKEELSKNLLDINREILIWERKVQMATDTKKCIDEEKGTFGDIGNMQSEIHRMKVRYSQLQKAQEKLLQDLQYCLSRREGIWYMAESTDKKFTAGGKPKNRIVLQRKREDLEAKIKNSEKELKSVEEKIKNSYQLELQMTREIQSTTERVEKAHLEIEDLTKKIAIGEATKYKTLEKLIFLQNKAKLIDDMTKGTYKFLFKKSEDLQAEYKSEMAKNGRLKKVTFMLRNDFPQHDLIFDKILHTLNLVLENLD